jgi:hypothetical protein
MTEKKQNTVKKNTVGKEVSLNHFDLSEAFGSDQYTGAGNFEMPDNLIKGLNVSIGQGNVNIHFHNEPCTINYNFPAIETPDDVEDEENILDWFLKIVPLMVKDSSITAAEFMTAVLKEVPLMVKDSSITQMELFAIMVVARDTLLVTCK